MKILLIVIGIIVLVAAVVAGVLAHPAFGVYRHVDKERIAKLTPLLQRHVPKRGTDAAVYRKRSPQYTHKGEEKGRRIVSDDLAVLDGSG